MATKQYDNIEIKLVARQGLVRSTLVIAYADPVYFKALLCSSFCVIAFYKSKFLFQHFAFYIFSQFQNDLIS